MAKPTQHNDITDLNETRGLPPPPAQDNNDHKDDTTKETRNKMSAVFGGIQKFKKEKLKETETVVKHIIRVTDYTAHHDPEEVKEYYTEPFLVKQLAQRFANMLLNSKHTVFHIGAGISTAAKLPDYRGPQGVWTLRAQGLEPQHQITLEQAVPTYSHMAIVTLFENNLLHYVVSTNVDGLHRRSGIKKSQMAELHGNIYREYCEECGAEYLRAFDTTKNCINRRTGRLCNNIDCNGKLRDSIINFGETLPEIELNNATIQTSKADLCVVFGSSLCVSPACDIPPMTWTQNKGKIVIVNLQQTSCDELCETSGGFRCGTKIDEFMKLVMQNLKINVPEYILIANCVFVARFCIILIANCVSSFSPTMSSSKKQPNTGAIAIYCGVSVGIGVIVGYLTSKYYQNHRNVTNGTTKLHTKDAALFDYITKSGNRYIPELQEIHDITYREFPKCAGMMTSKDQCYLLQWLSSLLQCRKAIEIGVFTGSSALCIAKGMKENGKLIAIDVNERYASIAREIWKKSGVDHKIDLKLDGGLKTLAALISDEKQRKTFDFAYVDAIKTEYMDYYEKLLMLMKKGGVIVFDNTLQRGMVVLDDRALNVKANKKIGNVQAIKKFNEYVRNDERVEMCQISLSDGVTLVFTK